MSDFYKGWVGDHIGHKQLFKLTADERDKLILKLEPMILKSINKILEICHRVQLSLASWQREPQRIVKRLEESIADIKHLLKDVHPHSSLAIVLQQLLDDVEDFEKFVKNTADLALLKKKKAAGKLKEKGFFGGKSGDLKKLEHLEKEVPKEQAASANLQAKMRKSVEWIDNVLRPLTNTGYLQQRILKEFMQRMLIEQKKVSESKFQPAF